jgi:hypothetical protein
MPERTLKLRVLTEYYKFSSKTHVNTHFIIIIIIIIFNVMEMLNL